MDSGATEHMCRDRALFSSFKNISEKSVIVGNGATIDVIGCGQVAVQVSNGTEWIDTIIENVLYVPELKNNLFSVNRAIDKGYVMMTNNKSCNFLKSNEICAVAKRIGDCYYLNLRYKHNYETASNVTLVQNDLNKWHKRLAHQNFNYVKNILQKHNVQINRLHHLSAKVVLWENYIDCRLTKVSR